MRKLLLARSLLVRVSSVGRILALFILDPWLLYHLILIRVLVLICLSNAAFIHVEPYSFLLFWLSFLVFTGWYRLILLLDIVVVAIMAYLRENPKSISFGSPISKLLAYSGTFK